MQTQTGILAQAIQQDRIRAYADSARLHRSAIESTGAQAFSIRKLLAGSIIRFGRPQASGPALARHAF